MTSAAAWPDASGCNPGDRPKYRTNHASSRRWNGYDDREAFCFFNRSLRAAQY